MAPREVNPAEVQFERNLILSLSRIELCTRSMDPKQATNKSKFHMHYQNYGHTIEDFHNFKFQVDASKERQS